MFAGDADAVVALPLNDKEESHRGRNRKGHHLYISRFCFDFKTLTEEGKRERILADPFLSEDAASYYYGDDESDVDSIDSVPVVRHVDIMRLGWNLWKYMSNEIKEGWNVRANILNARPIPGQFEILPESIETTQVLDAMSTDWLRFIALLRNAITRPPKSLLSSKVYCFGKERVAIGSQCFRTFELNELIRISLFGMEGCRLRRYEIIQKTRNSRLIHIASENRMKMLFELSGLCGVEFKVGDRRHTCCGKVSTRKNGLVCVGYIVDENVDGTLWTVQLVTNERIVLQAPQFDELRGVYIYSTGAQVSDRIIEQYWPIRFFTHNSGRGKFTLNRVTYDATNEIMMHNHSS
jgi:hypothetical protein